MRFAWLGILLVLNVLPAWAGGDKVSRYKVDSKEILTLEGQSSAESFDRLLGFLASKDRELSYRAVEALEKRKDLRFTESLLKTLGTMRVTFERDGLWPVYRLLGKYPSDSTVRFLIVALEDETRQAKSKYNDRNAFYIAESMKQIDHEMKLGCSFKALQKAESIDDYRKLASELKSSCGEVAKK